MTKMEKMLSVGLVGCMAASAMMMGAGAAQLTDACDVEDAASAAVDNAVSPYIVGTQFSVSGSNFLPFNIPSTKKVTKIWVRCETGRGLNAKVTDDQGNVVDGGTQQTIMQGYENDGTFYIIRPDGYTGNYTLWMKGLQSSDVTGWYHSVQGDDMSEVMMLSELSDTNK